MPRQSTNTDTLPLTFESILRCRRLDLLNISLKKLKLNVGYATKDGIAVGKCFTHIVEAKRTIKHFCTLKKVKVAVLQSNTKYFKVACSAQDCTFQIACRERVDGLVDITIVCLEHGCNGM
jgi:hypothetical protein